MDCRKPVLGIFAALLGASFMHQASAQWGTGGAVQPIKRKSILPGYDMICDLSRTSFGGVTIPEAQRVKINTKPGAGDLAAQTAQASFSISGQMFCAEINPLVTPPNQYTLENAVDLDGNGSAGDVGLFELEQVTQHVTLPYVDPTTGTPTTPVSGDRPGLKYFQVTDGGGVTTRTWTFVVPPSPTYPYPELLYQLKPVPGNVNAQKFCPTGATNCMALFGLQIPAAFNNHPGGNTDGVAGNELAPGEVFKFQTITKNGIEAAGRYSQLLCHSQAFIDPKDFPVKAVDHSSTLGGFGVGETAGPGLGTATDWIGRPLAITTNQNDLWNSGVLMDNQSPQQPLPGPQSNCGPGDFGCRWSNADGQNQVMFATGTDDSGHLAGFQIGYVHGNHTQHDLTLPVGRLVGKLGSGFFDIGVAKNFRFDPGIINELPGGGGNNLTLFYWDLNSRDNQGEIKVRVAERSIQCTAVIDGVPTPVSAQANVRGYLPVQVDYEPTLNVSNKSGSAAFPTVIFGTAALAFGPGGSPIIDPNGTSVFVNGQPVAIKDFSVEDTNGDSIPDLKLQLRRLDVISAVTPGGTCKDGPVSAPLEIGSSANGFFGGTDTIKLTNCKKL
jgi:hypothetical protein